MPESPRKLKPGWRMVRFGDVVELSGKRSSNPLSDGYDRFVGLDHIDPEDLRVRRWGDVADGTTFTSVFQSGQVLFGKRRAYQRKVAVPDFAGICSGDIYVLQSRDPKLLLPELLPFICQTESFFQHAVGTSAGSLSPRTNWTSLASFQFPLPPLAEQQRLSQALSAVERCLVRSDEALLSLQALRTAIIETFIRSLDAMTFCPVSELVTDGPKNGYSPRPNITGQGHPTLSISAIRGGEVVPDGNLKYAVVEPDQAAHFSLQKGDILVVRGNGAKRLVALAGRVGSLPAGCFYPDLLIRLRFDESKILSEFATLAWNSPTVHSSLLSRTKSSNGIWKINGKDIALHLLPVPSLVQQELVIQQVSQLSAAADQIRLRCNSVREMKSGFLAEMLREEPQCRT